MRVVFVLLLAAVSWGAGWILGSLNPAPKAVLAPVQNLLSSADLAKGVEIVDDLAEQASTTLNDAVVSNVAPDEAPEEGVDEDAEEAPEEVADAAPTVAPEAEEGSIAQYRAWISDARAQHPYPQSEARMFDVMMCESGGNPSIVNPAGPYTGLFQYATGTWNGDWNTYRDQGMTNARAQIFATALAWNLNMQSHWGCFGSTG